MRQPEIYIGVMGPTGAGKSAFINRISGSNFQESDQLDSCTSAVQISEPFELDRYKIRLVDTPGFDDSTRSQMDILKEVVSYLEVAYQGKVLLHGVLYFHRITDNRMGGIARKTFHMFEKLVGQESFRNVIVVTTMWDEITEERGANRLEELSTKDDLFKPVLDKGAHIMRHNNTAQSAQEIVRQALQNRPQALNIQKERVDDGKNIMDTEAGQEVNREAAELIRKYEEEIKELNEEAERRRKTGTEAEEALQKEIAKLKEQMKKVEAKRDNMEKEYKQQVHDLRSTQQADSSCCIIC